MKNGVYNVKDAFGQSRRWITRNVGGSAKVKGGDVHTEIERAGGRKKWEAAHQSKKETAETNYQAKLLALQKQETKQRDRRQGETDDQYQRRMDKIDREKNLLTTNHKFAQQQLDDEHKEKQEHHAAYTQALFDDHKASNRKKGLGISGASSKHTEEWDKKHAELQAAANAAAEAVQETKKRN